MMSMFISTLLKAKAAVLSCRGNVPRTSKSGRAGDGLQRRTGCRGSYVGKVKAALRSCRRVGFLPGSHVEFVRTAIWTALSARRTALQILKFNRARGNVVVSRRALLEKERETLKQDILKVLEEGVILEGTVKNIKGYGAFVDFGGIDGILHISDMSWGRINHPSEIVQVGDKSPSRRVKFDAEKELFHSA